jgi:hypothetical protein
MWKSALLTLCVGTALGAGPVFADDTKPAPDSAKGPPSEATCATDTGSHIPRKPGECGAAPSRRYTHDDIDRTGATTAGGALRNLSPALTVGH